MMPSSTTSSGVPRPRVTAKTRSTIAHGSHVDAAEQVRDLQCRLGQTSLHLQQTAWLVELLETLMGAKTLLQASNDLANQLKTQLRCDRVLVAWNNRHERSPILAVSDCATLDRNTTLMTRLQAAVDESAVCDDFVSWPPIDDANGSRPLIHQEIAAGSGAALTIPMTVDDSRIGSITLIGDRQIVLADATLGFLRAAAPSIAASLSCVRRGQQSVLRRAINWVGAQSAKRHATTMLTLALVVGIAIMPVNYKIGCKSTLEPVLRSFCVAPHDGTVETTLVAPGDVILTGQTLAQMDGRDVRWELAGLIAEQTRAATQYDTQMAAHETADAIQSKLEVARLQSKIDLLQHRASNLNVQSPIDGIVLSGSLDRRQNFPVDEGQVLYEVAPLDELRVEISIPNDEIGHVRVGQAIVLTFDGLGVATFDAKVEKIRPRSETRNASSVFVAECVLLNQNENLRPGMTGHAKIVGDEHSLAWVVCHRVIENVRVMMPW